jgi:GAF domain-containing protein
LQRVVRQTLLVRLGSVFTGNLGTHSRGAARQSLCVPVLCQGENTMSIELLQGVRTQAFTSIEGYFNEDISNNASRTSQPVRC